MKTLTELLKVQLRPAVFMLGAFTIGFGIVYPSTVKVIVEYSFNLQLEDNIVRNPSGRIVVSGFSGTMELRPQYFWGKIYGPNLLECDGFESSQKMVCKQAIGTRMNDLYSEDPDSKRDIPKDLVTIANSGLQPDISVDAVLYQVPRVAKARHLKKEAVLRLVETFTRNDRYNISKGLFINVLELNKSLDRQMP